MRSKRKSQNDKRRTLTPLNKSVKQKQVDLRFVLDGIPGLIGLWGADEINLQTNTAYSDYFGKNPDQIRGCHIRQLLGEDLYKMNEPYIKEVLAGRKVSFERALLHKDGSLHHTLVTYVPNFRKNKVVSFLVLAADVTALKTAENQRQKLQAQLAEAQKLTILGELAGGLAHEVNNPLAIIMSKSQLLILEASQRTLDWDSLIIELKSIESTLERISHITKALRAYSRDAENDQLEKVELYDILEDTLVLCRQRFVHAKVKIEMHCEPHLRINCRTAQISQVIMSLLNNSFDAISNLENKWIKIVGQRNKGIIRLEVTDSGLGISPTVAKKMMNPFFITKEVGKGAGLGLSVAAGIILSHGGTLNYRDDLANTSFVITLPEAHQFPKAKAA